MERTHGCSCNADPGSSPWACPVCTAALHKDLVFEKFGARCMNGFPLFPDSRGLPVQKTAMTATIQWAATKLGLQALHGDGQQRYTGHALRVAGAQSLAKAGLDTWCIALLARHSSSAIFGYIRDAPLGVSDTFASRAVCSQSHQTSFSQLKKSVSSLRTELSLGKQDTSSLRELAASFQADRGLASTQALAVEKLLEELSVRVARVDAQYDMRVRKLQEDLLEASAHQNKLWGKFVLTEEDLVLAVRTSEQCRLDIGRLNQVYDNSDLLERLARTEDNALKALESAGECFFSLHEPSVEGPWGGPFVANENGGVVHLVRFGDPGSSSTRWQTRCGWKFGARDTHRVRSLPLLASLVCERCMPVLCAGMEDGNISE